MSHTWRNLGTAVEDCGNYMDVLKKAGLDYEVVKKPAYIRRYGRYERRPDRFWTERRDESKVYDVVAAKYQVIQNRDAFDFVSYIGDDLVFEKAGETESGMIYIIGKLPDVDILGDRFVPHVIFANDFKAKHSVRAAVCPLRFVCQNQFSFAFSHTENTIAVRHTKNAKEKLREARIILKQNALFMQELAEMAENYARMQISPRQINMVLDAMFPIRGDLSPEAQAKIAREKQRFAEQFTAAYEVDDNYPFRGTAWGLINAYTRYATYREPLRKAGNWEETKFVDLTFQNKAGNISNNRFLKIVTDIAAA